MNNLRKPSELQRWCACAILNLDIEIFEMYGSSTTAEGELVARKYIGLLQMESRKNRGGTLLSCVEFHLGLPNGPLNCSTFSMIVLRSPPLNSADFYFANEPFLRVLLILPLLQY